MTTNTSAAPETESNAREEEVKVRPQPNPLCIPGIPAPWLDDETLGGRPGTLKRLLVDANNFNERKSDSNEFDGCGVPSEPLTYLFEPTPNNPNYYIAGPNITNVRCTGTRDPRLYSSPMPYNEHSGSLSSPGFALVRPKLRRGRRTEVNQYYFAHEAELSHLPTEGLVSQLTQVAMLAKQKAGLPPSADEYEKARNSAGRFVRNLRRPKNRKTQRTSLS